MSTLCTRCSGTGFLNIDQVPTDIAERGTDVVLAWIDTRNTARLIVGEQCECDRAIAPCAFCELHHDVQVCDCCGNGIDAWHGEPGRHYTAADPDGKDGPYAYNGGLWECH
jgi:hypothetical protein